MPPGRVLGGVVRYAIVRGWSLDRRQRDTGENSATELGARSMKAPERTLQSAETLHLGAFTEVQDPHALPSAGLKGSSDDIRELENPNEWYPVPLHPSLARDAAGVCVYVLTFPL